MAVGDASELEARELEVVLEEQEGHEDVRLTRMEATTIRAIRAARRDTLIRIDRALTSAVDLPMVSGPEATLKRLGAHVQRGLTRAEAEFRLAQYGANELDPSRDPNVFELVLLQVRGGRAREGERERGGGRGEWERVACSYRT